MEIRTLAEGLEFPEGPVALGDGSVILVEIAAGALTRVAPDGTVAAKKAATVDTQCLLEATERPRLHGTVQL
jgi:sugar lactone lactonase YvrE